MDPRATPWIAVVESDSSDHSVAEPNGHPNTKLPIAGIVASAGDLDAFKKFFAAMPITSGMAFVLVPHLDAKRKSSMVELLERQTSMPVVEATDGLQVEVDSVYIIPPNHFLSISQGILRLSDLPDPIGVQTAIDYFLRSLAQDQQERSIGIVFSGTGSHGTLGIREIKRCGGIAIVQSPEFSEFDQMPSSAIETGLVDFVLSPELMPETLLKVAKEAYVSQSRPPLGSSGNATEQLEVVLELIRTQTNYDFRSYRTNMILRRIERRMGLIQVAEFAKYVEVLKNQPNEVEALCKDFLIGVTAFFREGEATRCGKQVVARQVKFERVEPLRRNSF